MKKKLILVLTGLIVIAVSLFAGCSVEKGDSGEKGENGSDGLSAYEIYCKYYIYIESEKQWIDDLVAGRLENIDNSVLEEKIYWRGTIDDDFTDDEIILITDNYFSDKEFTTADFHMIEVEKVELITKYSTGSRYYLVTLKNKGKQSVIDAIRKLEIFAFVKSASPNMTFSVAE